MKKITPILITVMTMAGLITFNTAIAANGSTVSEIDKSNQVASLSITPEEMEFNSFSMISIFLIVFCLICIII